MDRATARTRTMEVSLTEYEKSEPVTLSVRDRDALKQVRSLTIDPVPGTEDRYHLTPGSHVGALEIGNLSVSIRPKLPIGRVLYLASYAMGEIDFRQERFDFEDAPSLVEALIPALVTAANRAFARGLLHGYRTEEESLHTVRGRIRINEQIRRRFGIPVPVEVRYDEFTDDVPANRLVKAAAARLGQLRIRPESRRGLASVASRLENVSLVEFAPNAVPEVRFDRLNGHYREVVTLARLILRHAAIETERGSVRATGFLMDMNVVFQEFVTRALRESLGVSERTLRSDEGIGRITLDKEQKIPLKPDLSWWNGRTCTFVGDAKYKNVEDRPVPNADLYQLLAYAIALNLPGGLLIYAHGEAAEAVYHVNHAGKQLAVAALDLSGTIDDLSARVDELACQVHALHREAEAKRRDMEFDRLRSEIAAAFSDKSKEEVGDLIDEAVAKVRMRSPAA